MTGMAAWHFDVTMEALPVMLQFAFLLFCHGLSRYLWNINQAVAAVVIATSSLGFVFYVRVVSATTAWYECPYQTPLSLPLPLPLLVDKLFASPADPTGRSGSRREGSSIPFVKIKFTLRGKEKQGVGAPMHPLHSALPEQDIEPGPSGFLAEDLAIPDLDLDVQLE